MELDLAAILGVTALVAGFFAWLRRDIAALRTNSGTPDRHFGRAAARAAGKLSPDERCISRRNEAPAPLAPAG